MWPMIAEPGLRCSECQHTIQPGRLCLSELPEEMPVGVNRSKFRNYCIGCPQCWRQGRHACYVRYLKSGNSVGRTPRSLPCARCGRRSSRRQRVLTYIMPKQNGQNASRKKPSNPSIIGTATAAAGVDTYHPVLRDLSDLQRTQGWEANEASERLRKRRLDSIPYPVRNLGEEAMNVR